VDVGGTSVSDGSPVGPGVSLGTAVVGAAVSLGTAVEGASVSLGTGVGAVVSVAGGVEVAGNVVVGRMDVASPPTGEADGIVKGVSLGTVSSRRTGVHVALGTRVARCTGTGAVVGLSVAMVEGTAGRVALVPAASGDGVLNASRTSPAA